MTCSSAPRSGDRISVETRPAGGEALLDLEQRCAIGSIHEAAHDGAGASHRVLAGARDQTLVDHCVRATRLGSTNGDSWNDTRGLALGAHARGKCDNSAES